MLSQLSFRAQNGSIADRIAGYAGDLKKKCPFPGTFAQRSSVTANFGFHARTPHSARCHGARLPLRRRRTDQRIANAQVLRLGAVAEKTRPRDAKPAISEGDDRKRFRGAASVSGAFSPSILWVATTYYAKRQKASWGGWRPALPENSPSGKVLPVTQRNDSQHWIRPCPRKNACRYWMNGHA